MHLLEGLSVWIIIPTALCIVALICLIPVFRRARAYIENVKTCGYLPPPPNKTGLFWLRCLSRFILFVQVGKVKVYGRENLEKLEGKAYIATPNHPHFADVALLPYVLDYKPARYMAARGVMTFGGGLGSLIFGPMGAFAVDLTKGKGGPAREAAIDVVASKQILGMFPEGWAYLDGVMGEFKKGAVRIARTAKEELGEETYLLPMYFRYGKYPGSWIRKIPPPAEYFLLLLLFPFYRRGARVVIGEPIASSDLPEDDAAATEFLKQAVIALDPATS